MALFKKQPAANPAHARIGRMLTEEFGDAFVEVAPGRWGGIDGTTLLQVNALYDDYGNEGLTVVNAIVLAEVRLTPELTKALLVEHRFLLGRWEVEAADDGTAIVFLGGKLGAEWVAN